MLNWARFNVPFRAQSDFTTISFFNGSSVGNRLSGLDSVSITAVPEPSSLVLVTFCTVGGLGAWDCSFECCVVAWITDCEKSAIGASRDSRDSIRTISP